MRNSFLWTCCQFVICKILLFSWFARKNSANMHTFLYKQHFYKQHQADIGKKSSKNKQHAETVLLLFEHYLLSISTLSSKNNRRYLKKCTKNKYVCLKEVIWFMAMKMRVKMKNISHRYNMNRSRPRHGHKYTKLKMCLSIMMAICISNT